MYPLASLAQALDAAGCQSAIPILIPTKLRSLRSLAHVLAFPIQNQATKFQWRSILQADSVSCSLRQPSNTMLRDGWFELGW